MKFLIISLPLFLAQKNDLKKRITYIKNFAKDLKIMNVYLQKESLTHTKSTWSFYPKNFESLEQLKRLNELLVLHNLTGCWHKFI